MCIYSFFMDKHKIDRILDEMGTFLSLKDENPFKIRAYHNAARALESLSVDLETLVQEKRLEEIPGIGAHMAEKITTLFTTGKLPAYDRLKKSIPPGLLEILKLSGMGAKKTKLLAKKLRIKTVKDLAAAAAKGKIAKLSGFGAKTQANIAQGISQRKTYGKRMLWWDMQPEAGFVIEQFSRYKEVAEVEMAGSYRRKFETVGDLDIVASSKHPERVIQWFIKQPWISKVVAQGPTKTSVRLKSGLSADLRVVLEEQFAAALVYFTGSKAHNIHLRSRANKQGWSLSEYGFESLKKKQKPPRIKTEEEIYQFLSLDWMPPELREDTGEIEAAEKHKLPRLIEEKDLRGAFHCHTTDSDGHNTLEEMVAAAQKLGWEYIGISDHSKSSFQANGMNEKQLAAQIERIEKLNRSKRFSTHIFSGIECDILPSGKLDFSEDVLKQLDFVIVSIHRSFQLDEKTQTSRLIKAIEHPCTTMVGHPTGRLLLQREPYAINLPKIIDACIANKKLIELNAHPRRLDMDWRFWHKAAERGLKCCINPDAHAVGDLEYVRAGVNAARKGWLRKEDVFNAMTLPQMRKRLGA
jgi:DNA polymerase (family 10)